MNSLEEKLVCIACNKNTTPNLFTVKEKHEVHKCNSCNSLFSPPINFDNEKFYDANYFKEVGYRNYLDNQKNIDLNFKRLHKYLSRYISHGKVLDIGCAYGNFLDILPESFDKYGVELCDDCFPFLEEKGIRATNSVDKHSESFDLVTLLDVFEHLENPGEMLSQIHKRINPGGYLFIETWDSSSLMAKLMGPRWHAITPPAHLVLFSKKRMYDILEENGFEIIEYRNFSRTLSLNAIFFRIFKKDLPLIKDLKFRYFFDDLIGVLAKKRPLH